MLTEGQRLVLEKPGKKAALITDASPHLATPSPGRAVNAESGFQGSGSFYGTLFFSTHCCPQPM